MYAQINEGKAIVKVFSAEKISKEMPVFYNPIMKLNRDISVLVLKSTGKKDMQMGLPLAGTGVRGVRFFLEVGKEKIKSISFNDYNPTAVKVIKENLKLNKIKKGFEVFCKDANMFLLESTGFDYIDIDPFGSPNLFLDAAVKRISREGILAVTATDTACLAGSYPKACLRKYWAMPVRNETMHENGLRILIRKVQLIGAEHNKALIPIFSYFKDHYFRAIFRCEKGKSKVDKIIKQHGMFNNAGPLWLGELWDKKLVEKMRKNRWKDKELEKFLKVIKEESKINVVGFYDVHKICKKYKLMTPKKDELISMIRKKGYKVSSTHFNENGLRSNAGENEVIKIIKSL